MDGVHASLPDDGEELVAQLDQVHRAETARYCTYRVSGSTLGSLWPETQTVGLRQLLAEQVAMVAERPEVFEVQDVSSSYGWVADGLERPELAELLFEAWRLTADPALVTARGDEIPR